jgi:hypothetical protein
LILGRTWPEGAGGNLGRCGQDVDRLSHRVAVMSGEAEADFKKGYRISLDSSRFLFDNRKL